MKNPLENEQLLSLIDKLEKQNTDLKQENKELASRLGLKHRLGENIIEQKRAEIAHDFEGSEWQNYLEDHEKFSSPTGKYYFTTKHYYKKYIEGEKSFGNSNFIEISVFEEAINEPILKYIASAGNLNYTWLQADEKEYLFLPEVYKSVVDLEKRTLYSFVMEKDNEAIERYFPSPNGLYLAVSLRDISYHYVVVYELGDIISLPYKEVFRRKLIYPTTLDELIWEGNRIKLCLHEEYRFHTYCIKVKLYFVGYRERLSCIFYDIFNKKHEILEKEECFGIYVDEKTEFPIDSTIAIVVLSYRTEAGKKIFKIRAEEIVAEVFEEQLEKYVERTFF